MKDRNSKLSHIHIYCFPLLAPRTMMEDFQCSFFYYFLFNINITGCRYFNCFLQNYFISYSVISNTLVQLIKPRNVIWPLQFIFFFTSFQYIPFLKKSKLKKKKAMYFTDVLLKKKKRQYLLCKRQNYQGLFSMHTLTCTPPPSSPSYIPYLFGQKVVPVM